jgi:hypothetical protein
VNKPITSKKFASDLWGVIQMAIDEAVAAEREACAKVCDLVAREMDDTNGTTSYIGKLIRARGQA